MDRTNTSLSGAFSVTNHANADRVLWKRAGATEGVSYRADCMATGTHRGELGIRLLWNAMCPVAPHCNAMR